MFRTLLDLMTILSSLSTPDDSVLTETHHKLDNLTKPQGSLGRLEEIILWLSLWQNTSSVHLDAPQCLVFSGHHGITKHDISAYPAGVTEKMVANFAKKGAAITQICSLNHIHFHSIPVQFDHYTHDITQDPAMSKEIFWQCFTLGFNSVPQECDILMLGEMGIGNTTPATALACRLLNRPACDLVGKGTGISDEVLSHKANIIERALSRHHHVIHPIDILHSFGGHEFASIAGAIVKARLRHIPLILDGFIVTAIAGLLYSLCPKILDNAIVGHLSNEKSHYLLLDYIGKKPFLDLGMRLGEGSGAALCYTLVKNAVHLYKNMASFDDFE